MLGESSFRFRVSTNLRFGVGECEKLGEEIVELGFKRVGVIIDKGVFDNTQVLKALKSLQNVGLTFDVFKNESVEPTYDYLGDFKRNFIGKTYDCLVLSPHTTKQ